MYILEPMSLARHSDFVKLWSGQTISEVGSRITREGLPLTAVLVLNATPAQMGVLAAIGGGSVLLFSLAAGLLVDRLRRRPVMIAADLGRAAVLATIPVAARSDLLSFSQLLVVIALSGILTVLFDVAYQSYLPALLDSNLLLEGNRRLEMSNALAEVIGPGLTGVLVQLITAPIAILLDALSFVASAVSVWTIRKKEAPPKRTWELGLRQELLAGARAIAAHSILRALALRSMSAFFFLGVMSSLYILYAIRVLHLSTSALGFTIALGGAGSMLGAFVSARVLGRFSLGLSFFATAFITGAVSLFIPLAAHNVRFAVPLLGGAQFLGDGAWTIYLVAETTLKQRVTATSVLGRVNAAMQLASRGVMPMGALVGGFLGAAIAMPATLWIAAVGLLASCLWLLPITRTAKFTSNESISAAVG
jgi:predicted MFS family arabinose efflux permease